MQKKTTFRIVGFSYLFAALFILIACGSGQETATYQMDEEGITTKVTLIAEDGQVTEHSSERIYPYDVIKVESKEDAQIILDSMMEPLKEMKGVDYKIDYEEDQAIETITVDLTSADIAEVEMIYDNLATEDIGILNLEEVEKELKQQGLKKVD